MAALRQVIKLKLSLWDASSAAEELLGCDIDTNGRGLENICVGLPTPEDADDVSEEDLIEIFELDTAAIKTE